MPTPQRSYRGGRASDPLLSRRKRKNRETSRDRVQQIPEEGALRDSYEELPFPKQVSNLSPRGKGGAESNPLKGATGTVPEHNSNHPTSINRSDSAYISGSFDSYHGYNSAPDMHGITDSAQSGAFASRVRQDILNGLAFFEQRSYELETKLIQMSEELRKVKELNQIYEDEIHVLKKEKKNYLMVEDENEKLKHTLEQIKEENNKLQEYFREQFHATKKAEEMYIELEARSNDEIKILRDNIKEKDDALNKAKASIAEHERKVNAKNKHNYDDELETMTRIERLQQDVKKLAAEKIHFREASTKAEAAIVNLTTQLEDKCKELENQKGRYETLRKDYESVHAEVNQLKKSFSTKRRPSLGSMSSASGQSGHSNHSSHSNQSSHANQSGIQGGVDVVDGKMESLTILTLPVPGTGVTKHAANNQLTVPHQANPSKPKILQPRAKTSTGTRPTPKKPFVWDGAATYGPDSTLPPVLQDSLNRK